MAKRKKKAKRKSRRKATGRAPTGKASKKKAAKKESPDFSRPLNARRRKFVDAYLKKPCGKEAAEAAGYSKKSAESQGSQILQDPRVQKLLREKRKPIAKKLDLKAKTVLREIARLGFSDILDVCEFGPNGVVLFDSSTLSADTSHAIVEVSQSPTQYGTNIKVKMHPKEPALIALAKYIGIFKEKKTLEVVGKGGGPVRVERGLSEELKQQIKKEIMGMR